MFEDDIVVLLVKYYVEENLSLLITIEINIYISHFRNSIRRRRYQFYKGLKDNKNTL
jgi:hypothetical protein